MFHQVSGAAERSVPLYERLLQAQPNNVVALNNLGWLYFEKADRRALELLEKAAQLAPENASVLDSYGWVLAKSGKVSEGVSQLEKAYKLAPDNAEIKAHLEQAKADRGR
jgi:Tfp pilus assembly protein PilF